MPPYVLAVYSSPSYPVVSAFTEFIIKVNSSNIIEVFFDHQLGLVRLLLVKLATLLETLETLLEELIN